MSAHHTSAHYTFDDLTAGARETDPALQRIRKLFTKAESVAGTPEADALLERAYALLAKYGIDEALARSAGCGVADTGEVVVDRHEVVGRYVPDRVALLSSIGHALHCQVVSEGTRAGCHVVVVIGVRRHTERVRMLTGALTAVMLGGAARQVAPPGTATVSHRKSYMTGFASEVHRRLRDAEWQAVAECSEVRGAELVVVSDARRAADELRRRYPFAVARRRRAVGVTGLAQGRAAASRVDLGQRRFAAGPRAIGA